MKDIKRKPLKFVIIIYTALLFYFSIDGDVKAQITVSAVRVTASFQHILVGVYINPGTNVNASMDVTYRKVGTTQWMNAYSGIPSTNDPYWLSTIISNLEPDTNYELHIIITDPEGVINGEHYVIKKTLSLNAPINDGQKWYISPDGNDTTGDGSPSNPWKSITRASQSTAPGDTVIIKGGTYPCEQIITNSGNNSSGYIIFKAESGQTPIFDCSDPLYATPNSGNHFTPVAGRPGVYSTTLSYEPAYVAAEDKRLYNYAYDESGSPLDALTTMVVTHNNVQYPVAGWLYQNNTLYVHLENNIDPDTVSMHIASNNNALTIYNADYIAIIGLTIQYADTGIEIRGDHTASEIQPMARYAWIDSNNIHHINTGITTIGWLVCSSPVSTDASIGAPYAVIIRNNINDAVNTNSWPWDIKKGSDAENNAISLRGGDAAIVRGNNISDVFNGISASNWGDCFWGGFPLESAGMNRHAVIDSNVFSSIGDDVIEPEGAIINFLIYGNKSMNSHTGISMAPIGEGPVWVIHNVIIDYEEGALKFWDGLSVNRGWILIFNNTFVTRKANKTAMLIYPSSAYNVKVKMRNNIFMGTDMEIDQGDENWANNNVNLDYDNFYSTGLGGVLWYYSGMVLCPDNTQNDHCWYDSVSQWISHSLQVGQPQEQNGLSVNPLFINYEGSDFHLQSTSELIDRGILIVGINDNYYGNSPDIGAYEYQSCQQSFNDVLCNYWAYEHIEKLVSSGITGGCQAYPPLFCPENYIKRDQMAVFIIKSMNEMPSSPCSGQIFSDVSASYWACGYIEKIAELNITGGCAPSLYCPTNNVKRDSMAVLLINALNEMPVSPCAGFFLDVPSSHWACGYIERLVQLNIASGCSANYYCPNANITRAQMAKFLALAFNL